MTREPFATPGRITDRICSMAMIKEVAGLLEAAGLKEGSNAEPGDFVLERAFVGWRWQDP